MQQIGNDYNNKKDPENRELFICKTKVVRECDVGWNSTEASLTLFYRKMLDLGFTFDGNDVLCPSYGEVIIGSPFISPARRDWKSYLEATSLSTRSLR